MLVFLGKLGVITAKTLTTGWRYALVGVSVLAAVATPSNDAFSMIAMALPLVVLYFVSIALVRAVEPKQQQ
jgi:sec-independent protein translocase protein TatC